MTEVVEVSSPSVLTTVEIDNQVISIGTTQVVEVGYSQPGGSIGDKFYEQAFNNVSTVTVVHGLGKRPAVSVVNSANDVVITDVAYVDDNTVRIDMPSINSGTVYCN